MAQGLSTPSPLHTLSPRRLQELVAQHTPSAVIMVHPQMLQAYHGTAQGGRADLYPQPVDQAGEETEDGSLALKKGAKKSQDLFKKLESVEQ